MAATIRSIPTVRGNGLDLIGVWVCSHLTVECLHVMTLLLTGIGCLAESLLLRIHIGCLRASARSYIDLKLVRISIYVHAPSCLLYIPFCMLS
jgi:hypothetical protein